MDACIDALKKTKLKVTTAESCTGGGIAFALTQRAGSSAWFDQGWVTYTAESKHQQLGVCNKSLAVSVVSSDVAFQMARGALERSNAQISVSITGVAGPTGGDALHPVGCCWFGFVLDENLLHAHPALRLKLQQRQASDCELVKQDADQLNAMTIRCDFAGDREAVRSAAVRFVLSVIDDLLTVIV